MIINEKLTIEPGQHYDFNLEIIEPEKGSRILS